MKKIFFILILFSSCEEITSKYKNNIIENIRLKQNGLCSFAYYASDDWVFVIDSCNKHKIGDTVIFTSK